jgi:tRNA(fMet)-specific endonuclease VapC
MIFPLDEKCVDTAVRVNANLKRKRKQIDLADLLIASTAISHKLIFATLNRKHFDRIDELTIID